MAGGQVFGQDGDPATVCNWMSVLGLLLAAVLAQARADAMAGGIAAAWATAALRGYEMMLTPRGVPRVRAAMAVAVVPVLAVAYVGLEVRGQPCTPFRPPSHFLLCVSHTCGGLKCLRTHVCSFSRAYHASMHMALHSPPSIPPPVLLNMFLYSALLLSSSIRWRQIGPPKRTSELLCTCVFIPVLMGLWDTPRGRLIMTEGALLAGCVGGILTASALAIGRYTWRAEDPAPSIDAGFQARASQPHNRLPSSQCSTHPTNLTPRAPSQLDPLPLSRLPNFSPSRPSSPPSRPSSPKEAPSLHSPALSALRAGGLAEQPHLFGSGNCNSSQCLPHLRMGQALPPLGHIPRCIGRLTRVPAPLCSGSRTPARGRLRIHPGPISHAFLPDHVP
jgi:hypothetical protein